MEVFGTVSAYFRAQNSSPMPKFKIEESISNS